MNLYRCTSIARYVSRKNLWNLPRVSRFLAWGFIFLFLFACQVPQAVSAAATSGVSNPDQTRISTLFSSNGQALWYSLGLVFSLGIAFAIDRKHRKTKAKTPGEGEPLDNVAKQYRAIVDHMREGLAVIHPDSQVTLFANQPLLEIFQVPPGQLFDIFAHLDDPAVEELQRHIRTRLERSFGGVYRGKTVQGESVWLDMRISTLFLEEGEVGLLLVHDISRQKRFEESLQISEQRYHSLYDTTQRQSQEIELIIQVRLVLANEIDPKVVFRKVVEAVAHIFGYTLVSVYMVEGEELVLQHQFGYETIFPRISIHNGISGRVARTGQPNLVKDVASDPDFMRAKDDITSEICVPLFDEDRVVGILNAESNSQPPLDENDLRILSEISHHVNFAINRARLYTEARQAADHLRKQNEYLNALHETTLGVINRLDLNDLLSDILTRAGQLLGTDHVYIYQYQPETDLLEVTHGVGIYQKFIGYQLKPGEGMAGRVFLTGEALVLDDYDIWEGRSPAFPAGVFHAAIGVPLNNGPEVFGVLGITHLEKEDGFGQAELEVANRFAQLVSLGIGNAQLYSVMQEELSIRQRIQEELRISEERYELVIRGASDGFWDWDLRSGQIFYSPRWKAMLGCSETMICDSPLDWFSRVHPEDIDMLKDDIQKHLTGETLHLECEHRILHQDGDYRWVLVRGLAVHEPGLPPHRMAGSLTDITLTKTTEERLLHDAMHDPLTGLPNRLYFMDQIRRTLERCKRRSDYQAAVLSIDLDRFKIVNDSLGHSFGDQMLVATARRLEGCLRAGDIIARFGGDEFAILVDDIIDIQDAIRVANRIQDELTNSFNLQGHEVFSSASIGIAVTSSAYHEPETLYRDADTAMFQAKAAGRARHQIFDNEMHASSLALLKLEADLRRAIERKEFILYYQPIISLTSGQITSFEVLIRWLNTERGMVPPDQFIGLAEETGLIVPIGKYVLFTACTQAKAWYDQGHTDIKIAINLSARQLQDPRLPELVRDVLVTTGLPPTALHLEITESAAMKDYELTIQTLTEIRKMGVQFSIDDFGTSYSSLDYLKRFPVSSIKIDRSFIRDIMEDPDDAAITAAIIAMGHVLNLNLIAEGVETAEQLSFLNSQACDECQGYLFYKPMPASQIPDLLADKHNLIEAHLENSNQKPVIKPPLYPIRKS